MKIITTIGLGVILVTISIILILISFLTALGILFLFISAMLFTIVSIKLHIYAKGETIKKREFYYDG